MFYRAVFIMSKSREDLLKIIRLARLSAANEDLDKMTRDFNSILQYVEQLEKVDVTNVEPLSHVHGVVNVFRDDAAHNDLTTGAALQNAPDKSGAFIRVPLIIEEE
jgi:aspartyl-tRNA(Asn)/glutamyl-tRNA(Gln) amidotransferase subunit C